MENPIVTIAPVRIDAEHREAAQDLARQTLAGAALQAQHAADAARMPADAGHPERIRK